MLQFFKKKSIVIFFLFSMNAFADSVSATSTCEFTGNDNFGICYQNTTGQALDEQIMLVVQADQYISQLIISSFPTNWYADSTTNLADLKQSGIHLMRYLLVANGSEVNGCTHAFIVEDAAPMTTPLIAKLAMDENHRFYCVQ